MPQTGPPPPPPKVGFEPRAGARVPLNLPFRNESWKYVSLGECTAGKPTVLVLAYYRCPMLCTEVLNGLLRAVKAIPDDVGSTFNVVVVSFDPREKPPLAALKKATYTEQYDRPGTERGWHFLTGESLAIEALAQGGRVPLRVRPGQRAVRPRQRAGGPGPRRHDRAVPAGDPVRARATCAWPSPRPPRARSARRPTRCLLLCYRYDPTTGKYTPAVLNIVRLASARVDRLHRRAGRASLLAWAEESDAASRGHPTPRHDAGGLHMLMLAQALGVPFFPEQASDHARQVDYLFFYLLGVTGGVAVLVCPAAGRLLDPLPPPRRGRPDAPDHGLPAPGVELDARPRSWSSPPCSAGAWSLYTDTLRPPPDAFEVFVVGKQWMWKIQHPGGQREINELHLPVDRPVKLTLISEDVIHDFSVPAFRIKIDVLPGRYVSTWFQPTQDRARTTCSATSTAGPATRRWSAR